MALRLAQACLLHGGVCILLPSACGNQASICIVQSGVDALHFHHVPENWMQTSGNKGQRMITTLLTWLLKRSPRAFIFTSGHPRCIDGEIPGLGLYLHIPFCRSLCRFCPYFKERFDPAAVEPFVAALKQEIRAAGELAHHSSVSSVYYGGGTPYLLGKHLQEIQDQIERSFAVEGPCGIELHPEDIDFDTSSKLRDAGFTMVSIGAQSFQANCLRVLGRTQGDVSSRIAMMKDAAMSVIDVDLIFGLPGQTAEDIQQDFRVAVASGATQISTYPFIDFTYANNPQRPLGRRRKKNLLKAVLEVSADLGFHRTSVWTFARKDSRRYSSVTRDNYIGFGPSAASLLPSGFSMNVFSVGEYIHAVEEGRSPTALEVDFTERERALFWLFWSIYNLHVSKADYFTLFGKPLDEMFGWELRLAAGMGLVKRRNDAYVVTARGAYLFHLVEQGYTDQYIDKVWGFARSTPWPEKLVIR